MAERDGRGGVARDDGEPRLKPLDEAAKQRGHARGKLLVAFLAVGQTSIIGGVDERRGRKQRARRAEHGEPAEAAVEKRSEEHTSELQSLMRISYAVFCLKKKKTLYSTQHK